MAIIRGQLRLKGKILILALGTLPKFERQLIRPQEPAPHSGPSADDLAFLSRMIKLGLERQAKMPAPNRGRGLPCALALHRPRSGDR
jgi:hypothetical protein